MTTIRIEGRSEIFHSRESEPVLTTLVSDPEKSVRVGCRGGGCGVCKIQIISGEFRCEKMSKAHISDGERGNGVVLACKTFAKGDLVVRPLTSHRKWRGQIASNGVEPRL